MAFVLDQLKPNQKYFEAICGIPHPSTEEKAVSDYVCSVAENIGVQGVQTR
jgi:di/tripeptidase